MPNHIDKRGTITDLLVTEDYSITHITFTEGAVRGNHYHEHTDQFDLILKGRLLCSRDGSEMEITQEDRILIPRGVKHAYKAIEDSEMLSICWGIRKGDDYEKDVIRLEHPLL